MNISKSPQTATSLLSVIGLLAILTIPNIGLSQISRSPTRILQEAGNTVTFDNGSIEVVVQRSGNLLITDKGTYHLSSGQSVTPQSSSVAPSASLPVTMSPSTRNSSSRQSKSDQLQGELMQSIQMGAILQEQGNSEREYKLNLQRQELSRRALEAELTKQENAVQREIDLDTARGSATDTLYAIDPMSPDASDRLREAAAGFGSILPASEWRNLFDPVNAAVQANQALVKQHRGETGMDVPLDKDGRYDFGAATEERKELLKAFEGGLNPLTLGALNQVEGLRDLPISHKLAYGQEHEVADQMMRWAVQHDELSYDEISKMGPGLYITEGASNDTLQQGRAGHVYNLRAVEGIKLANGRTLGALFKQARDVQEISKQNAASGGVVGEEISMLMDEGKLLQRLVHGDPEADIKAMDKKDPSYNKRTERLDYVMGRIAQLQGAKSAFDAGGAGTYSPQETIVQGNQGALDRKGITPKQVESMVLSGFLDEEGAKAIYEGKEIQFGNSIYTLTTK